MTTDYKNTSLWRAAFAGTGLSQAQEESRNRLRTALARIEADIESYWSKYPKAVRDSLFTMSVTFISFGTLLQRFVDQPTRSIRLKVLF
jgi:hypothetical protein